MPFLTFAQNDQTEKNKEEPNQANENVPKKDEIALSSPSEETLKKDFNELTQAEASQTNDPSNLAPQNTFPIQTTLGYNLEDVNSNYFLQIEGADILNEEKTRKINFLIKVPYLQINDSVNKLGALPQRFNINFIDPFLNVTIGDSKYDLSPLIMKEYEKRGAFLKINYNDIVGISSAYLTSKPNSSKDFNPTENFGISFFVKPLSFIKLATNFLSTTFKEENFSTPKNNYSYSIRSTISFDEKNKLDLETATSNKLNKDNIAYFINLDGKNDHFTYLVNWLYANPEYVGKYSDKTFQDSSLKTKFDGSLKYDLNNFSTKLSHNFENINLDKISEKDAPKRNNNSEFSISYPILFPMKSSLIVKRKEAKSFFTRDGFKLNAINLITSIPIKKYTIENSVELGRYKSRIENYIYRNWHNYQLSIKYIPSENNGFSIYTKLGNLLYEDVYALSYALGADLKIKTAKNLDLNLVYEYSRNNRKSFATIDKQLKWKGNYFKQDLTYILPNEHKITLSSHLNKPLMEKEEKAFLLTYTIPFQAPNINRTISAIRNRLF
jgi:hypothetical protein